LNRGTNDRSVDEAIELSSYDSRWPLWFAEDAAELRRALDDRIRGIEHFGSTAVRGMVAKPIIDILVGLATWPITVADRQAIENLQYEYLGEAGVPGREYFRRRRDHSTNVAVVEWRGRLWRDNVAVRDYLRSHPDAASAYARAKEHAWSLGARTLLAYSDAKGAHVASLVEVARRWGEEDAK
jgi:GrpB-like predicted nucleotidyltransferase (UPF0157 family)